MDDTIMHEPVTRRQFVRSGAAVTTGLAVGGRLAAREPENASHEFASHWQLTPDRVWIGPDYWANPLQDWRVADGRLECIKAAPDRNLQLLTRQLARAPGELKMSVRVGALGEQTFGDGRGSAGFRIGIRGPLDDYRNSLIFGSGLDAGIAPDGRLFIGPVAAAHHAGEKVTAKSVELRLAIQPSSSSYTLTLTAHEAGTGARLSELVRDHVAPQRLEGNLALVANFAPAPPARGRRTKAGDASEAGYFWFADWRLAGSKLERHDERALGPVLFSQYTLSRGTLKMTAQMPPLGPRDAQTVRLEVLREGHWRSLAEEPIHPDARTATFRVEKWDDTVDVPYRVVYSLRSTDGSSVEHAWSGTVRRDPVDKPVLSVADISCNLHSAFPNSWCVESLARLDPDMLAFTGDQFYEGSGGYGVVRAPLDAAILDVLRKWYLHGWTWRELMRDRPSISIPDDHDVYQGNVWGEGGEPRRKTQEGGGYDMPPEWVNVVHRTQTAHHPDFPDPTPAKRGISVYYGSLVYGRVSFAILADRQFKSGPEGKVPPTGDRGDHVVDPEFDPHSADLPGLQLLGPRQLAFLRQWAVDWRGADMKAVVSQTIFTAMATTHGPKRERLRADYDANGWPQTARNAALREIRKAFAFHLAGDQHLPAVIHYGVDEHEDAVCAFAGPAVNNVYPRWFEPDTPGENREPDSPGNTGRFRDHFDHPLTVLAVANPRLEFRREVLENEQDRAAGLGLVRFDKARRKIAIECWPFLADVTRDGTQFPGWPLEIDVLDNYRRGGAALLPTLEFVGVESPLIQVFDDSSNELVYNLRVAGRSFQPHVFAPGTYTVRVSDPDSDRSTELRGVSARSTSDETVQVKL